MLAERSGQAIHYRGASSGACCQRGWFETRQFLHDEGGLQRASWTGSDAGERARRALLAFWAPTIVVSLKPELHHAGLTNEGGGIMAPTKLGLRDDPFPALPA